MRTIHVALVALFCMHCKRSEPTESAVKLEVPASPAVTPVAITTTAPAVTPEPTPTPVPTATATMTTTTTTPTMGGIVVDRSTWTTQFEAALPIALCKPTSYFRQCFRLTAQQCQQTAASTTRVCLNRVRASLPTEFHQPADGEKWGREIGTCAGTRYELSHTTEKIQSTDCNDPSKWVP